MQYLEIILRLLPALLTYRQARGSKDPVESAVEALTAITPVLIPMLEKGENDEKEIQTKSQTKQAQIPQRRR